LPSAQLKNIPKRNVWSLQFREIDAVSTLKISRKCFQFESVCENLLRILRVIDIQNPIVWRKLQSLLPAVRKPIYELIEKLTNLFFRR